MAVEKLQSSGRVAALVLAGGRSSRMGVPKESLLVGGTTLLATVVAAVADCSPIIVIGPESVWESLPEPRDERVVRTQEDPPGGGPCAGLAAGIALAGEDVEWVQVLTCDLPRAAEVVSALAGCPGAPVVDALVAVDSEGWPQLLAGRYRTGALRTALSGVVRDRSVRRVLGGLSRHEVPLPDELLADVDDPEAAARAGVELPPRVAAPEQTSDHRQS